MNEFMNDFMKDLMKDLHRIRIAAPGVSGVTCGWCAANVRAFPPNCVPVTVGV
jgi:hypothetical protein